MATADLMVVIVVALVEQINNIYSYSRSLLITPVCALTLVLRVLTTDCSVWFTVSFTFDRFIAICCRKLRERYCTERTATGVIVTVVIVSCGRSAPLYFALEPYVIIDNQPWRCTVTYEYVTSPEWRSYQLLDSILTPLLPIGLILVFNGLTVRHIVVANRVRRRLRHSSDNQKDAEVEKRRKSMILLFAISANLYIILDALCGPFSEMATRELFLPGQIFEFPGIHPTAICVHVANAQRVHQYLYLYTDTEEIQRRVEKWNEICVYLKWASV
ncbi:uncharacterized protein LOC132386597 [Hypanus sabinus]|uniref:uncharacterized protein LOC132386597 n=1 Tax=Hypanus sabinus TaxID=79690 RepID=UPI0028C46083|nr:uncharacterized protein LOC132386597 [Hypanus sabinus]